MNMRAPVAVEPREMWRDESLQRFVEGLKLAASCAKELNGVDPKQGWGKVADMLLQMVVNGRKLSRVRGLTRQEVLARSGRIQTTQNPNVQQS